MLGVEDETVRMLEGELWVMDNKKLHWAKNLSDKPRIHLIFDLLPALGRGFYAYP